MNKIYLFLFLVCTSLNGQESFEGLIKFSTQISTTDLAAKEFKLTYIANEVIIQSLNQDIFLLK